MLPPAIPSLIEALFRGDAAAARNFIDPDFGIHDGHNAETWLVHEISEFAKRRPALNLEAVQVTDQASRTIPGAISFAVLCQDGRFVFEDSLKIGPTGLVRGLGRRFEIVTKMHYRAGQPLRRGIAIRSPRGDIVKAVVLGVEHDDAQLHPGSSHDDDHFFTLDFSIPVDNHEGIHANLFVRDSAGVSAIEPIFLRGYDSPHHGSVEFPGINGNMVSIFNVDHKRLWSLSVRLEDGSDETVEHPTGGKYRFDLPVQSAIVTDAMDNDWVNS